MLLSGILWAAAVSEARIEHHREEPRERDHQRQHHGERHVEARNTPGDAAGHDRMLATPVQRRRELVFAVIVGCVRATAKSRRAARAERSGCCPVLHIYYDAGAMPQLPGLPSFGL